MGRRLVSITDSKAGDIIFGDIYNDRGVMIVARNTILTPYIQDKLDGLGIRSLYILTRDRYEVKSAEFQAFQEDYWDSVLSVRQVMADLLMGRGLNADRIKELSQTINNKLNQASTIVQCLQLLKSADEYTYMHCINTAFYAMLIGKWMELSGDEVKKLIYAGLLHDIGKVQIPEGILYKKGILTKEEYEIIKKHPVIGYGILQEYDEIDPEIKRAVLLHHERVDRSGYPFNAAADCVGLYARIIAVADVYDAMTSERVYKKRATPFEAFEMFTTVGIGIFDTCIMSVFIKNISAYFVGMNAELSNGEVGRIVYVPPHGVTRPIVQMKDGYLDLSQQSDLRIVRVYSGI